nr:Amuc_1098 family type IV pilus outer membrane protein [Prosthecobacter sp.]
MAQNQSTAAGMASKEIARRYARIEDARTAMDRGDKLFSESDYDGALNSYKAAIDSLPNAPLTRDWLDLAQLKYADCSVTVAQERAKAGNYKEARQLLEGAMVYVPRHQGALAFLKQLEDPDRWPPALTAEHVTNVGKVQAGLLLGNSSVEIGNYDAAISQYQDVLRTDPYNSAARRGMENAERKRQAYFKTAYDHQRAKMLAQVTESWEDKVPVQGQTVVYDYGVGRSPGANLTEKMNKIMFPTVQFDGATIEEAIEYLRVKSRDLDTFTDETGVKGVNIILQMGEAPSNATISLDLKDVPMSEALRYVTDLAQMKYKVEAHAVLVVPLSANASEQYTRSYRVPPDFLSSSGGSDSGPAPAAATDPFATGAAAPGGSGLTAKKSARQILEASGIQFPEGSSASYNPANSQLVVRNTQPNLDLVEAYVESITKLAPKMVVITSKFVEVTQKNNEELGFDWLLGGISTGGVAFGGGSSGNGNAYNAGDYPFQSTLVTPGYIVGGEQVFPNIPAAGAYAGAIPLGAVDPSTISILNPTGTPSASGGGPITSGNRSGGYAINNSSIDNLLTTGSTTAATSVAPGIFSTAGIFGNAQFQNVIRGLSQKKGVDLMSAPSVTTKSGTRATMEVTREFIYPTEFDPPRLPQGGGGLNVGGGGGGGGTQIATPTTPTAFEMRQTGVRLEAEPTVGADGNTIELTLAPEVVEFDGFINYGSPILSPSSQSVLPIQLSTGTIGYVPLQQPERLITANIINQPVFSVRKVTTGVSIWDGQTVALGGLIREDVQDVQDKVPILGDLPFIGRLFKSESEQHYKRNLMIFVTAHLIDPSGQRIKPVNGTAPATADAGAAGPGSVGTLLPPVTP